ncbi:pyruvate,water dikinase [Antricoccus suffuscus]|uniref:Pyruvate,water dikinase n=1 Tax=Antricoccus suffuscus TaxID=1629062 RepID=A0A2T1A312_9ACTN|nr:PEP/pyruvate-binding domain-containing protein [Antricoccus suffuscus]PRZ42990.1 pyruvate,water dikinase [Antricoccus suffuscus]
MSPVTDDRYVVSLARVREYDVAKVGRKAATLAELINAGFAVPEGIVLTTSAFVDCCDGGGGGRPQRHSIETDSSVAAAVATIADHFAGDTVVVRSSAIDEDLPHASYAGQYDSILDVRGGTDLCAAIEKCWASANADRARSYRSAADTSMAVLVQRQLSPDIAGVAFTANPVTGDRNEVLVSAVPGLGIGVVDGTTNPDEWVVAGTTATPVRVDNGALTAAQARSVAVLARRVEARLGCPQDIEWAMQSGLLMVLQARPITALPTAPAVELPPGPWFKETDRYAEPMTALGASIVERCIGVGLGGMFRRYGAMIDRVEVRSIGGEIYQQLLPFHGKPEDRPPPWWVLAVVARVVPSMRTRMRTAGRAADRERLNETVRSWYDVWRPDIERRVAEHRSVAIDGLSNSELAAHFDRLGAFVEETIRLHFRLMPPHIVPLYRLVALCHRLFGWDTARALDLVSGTSAVTSAPSEELHDLAAQVQESPELCAALAAGADPGSTIRAYSPSLGAAFDDWCDRYADRNISDDPGSPTLRERPVLLSRLLLDGRPDLSGQTADVRQAAIDDARRLLAGRRARDRQEFERAYNDVLASYCLREDSAFWTASMPAALVRPIALEIGRRLVAAGRLDRAEDAVQLEFDVLSRALGDDTDLHQLVIKATAERAWARQHPGPISVGPEMAPPPDIRGLPRSARELNAALLWSRFGDAEKPEEHTDALLVGTAGAPGRYTGPVRVITDVSHFDRIQQGDVLVCHTTDPAWSVLFGVASALITNVGGVLSHAAIVAREYGLPAALGTGTATAVLHDGQIVTVDGSTGTVTAG